MPSSLELRTVCNRDGGTGVIVVLPHRDLWLCPVCACHLHGYLPWGDDPATTRGYHDVCPDCKIQYGLDDFPDDQPDGDVSLQNAWRRYRDRWRKTRGVDAEYEARIAAMEQVIEWLS
ncbi:MAG: hypothetical protein AAF297_06930 [Planctomycetota bacterium]